MTLMFSKAPKPVRDKAYIERVKNLPCSVCGAPPPSDAHHCKGVAEFGTGTGIKACDYNTIPLCKAHHQNSPVAFHSMGQYPWEAMFGTQVEHVRKTKEKLAEMQNIW